MDGVLRQAVRAPFLRDLAADDGADNTVDVADGQVGMDAFAAFDGRLADVQQPCHVERLFNAVILVNLPVAHDLRPDIRPMQNACEVEALRLPMLNRLSRGQLVRAADHFVYGPEAEFGHDLA